MSEPLLTYKESGVDIHSAADFVQDIGQLRARTEKKRQLFNPFGLFAASFDLSNYKKPVIVTGCDGVGSKAKLLFEHDLLEIAGKDLVAMNVNDVLTTGANPVLFLDYIGVAKLDRARLGRLVAGMVDYLEACDCILAGGETAEMPGIVPPDIYELAGFCIGVAEKGDLLDPATVAVGNVLIGFPSVGFHANGFTLIRKVLEQHAGEFSHAELHQLLAPTPLYHEEVRAIRAAGVRPKAMAHITGGGLPENLDRLLIYGGGGAHLRVPHWENELAQRVLRHVDEKDAINTFNMGIGWVVMVAPDDVDKTLNCGRGAVVLGECGGTSARVEILK